MPPMRQAVLGAGSGTLFGKMDISKAIRDGKVVTLNPLKSQLCVEGQGLPEHQLIE